MLEHIRALDLPPDSAVHEALAVLRDERDAARREAAHYRRALLTIEHNTRPVHFEVNDPVLLLNLAHRYAGRALLWEGRERRRTWRDIVAAAWQTWRARRRGRALRRLVERAQEGTR